jgi:hypothetical protein
LIDSIIEEGSMREWTVEKGPQGEVYEDVESKDITRERMGRSPDLFDMLVTGLEGARRLGFKIVGKYATPIGGPPNKKLKEFAEKYRKLHQGRQLTYS